MISSNKKRILCVDDTEDSCELLSFVLTQAGYEVESTHSVQKALQLLESNQFTLCLFDLSLSDGTGFELLEKVQTLGSAMPVIICSGDVRDSTRTQAMQANAQAFFSKPIDFDLLVETVAKFHYSAEPAID